VTHKGEVVVEIWGRCTGDACLAQAEAEARAAELGLRAMRQKEGGHEAALRRASAAQAISPIPPLYLPYISPISPLYLRLSVARARRSRRRRTQP
jgi:hypothetical protein